MKEKEIQSPLFTRKKILGNGFLWCTIFLFSCLGSEKEPGFKFFFFPTSLQNFTNSPVSPPTVTPNQANLSVGGGKSLYNGVYYASRVADGGFGLNVGVSLANVSEGSILKICMNETGCVNQSLLFNGSIGPGIGNLDLNLKIPDEYPVVPGGNTLNFAVVKDSQIVVQRSVSTIYDVNGPTLTFSASGGSYSSAQTLSITCTDSVSGCQNVIYTADGQNPSLALGNDFDPLQISLGSVFPSSLNIPVGTTTIKVSGSDRAGNITGPLTATYVITTPPSGGGGSTPPTISLDSVDNSITNGTNQSVLHWDSDTIGTYSVVPSGTDCTNIPPGDVLVSGTLSTPGSVDTTVPYSSLSGGSNSLTLCFADASGQTDSVDFTLVNDTTAPTLVSSSPANSAVDVDVFNRNLILTFNENMQPDTSVEVHAFLTYGVGGGATTTELILPTSLSATWISETVLALDLDTILPEFTAIKIRILASDLKDVAGNTIAGDAAGFVNVVYTTGGMVALRNIIDSNQPGCFDASGNGVACTGSGQDAAFTATPNAQVIGVPTFLSGFTSDPVTIDSTSGLTWRTCVQGMEWTGATCGGTPTEVNWTQALASCSALNERNSKQGYAGIKNWRLTTMDDLHSNWQILIYNYT
ncbi:DUF1566 domain-containing protein [Leptospira gomenensis]|uniref:Ig-like domain-containing protein n=1 Tax=Leptospira gomenensis TaxID=2484974 RepID=UPI001090C257|nr:Ig-like domain-containing protein [Leptospira gomenensis]TGK39520.1 DUF1566 domain-containing protein [Leptospira gomenensis]